MRALTVQPVKEVSGGSYLSDVTDLATQTGLIGSIVGYAATGTAAGATTGGWWGPGVGVAWGAGTGAGTYLYDRYVSRLILNGTYQYIGKISNPLAVFYSEIVRGSSR